MNQLDKITTLASFNEYKFKEKGSQFIGQAFPVQTEEKAKEILVEVKKEFYDARHHCFAYQIGEENEFKYSDDGEPNGSAGIRILNAIHHFDLTNVIVVSIRYFGGVKLGVGPLGKAYYNSAYGALDSAKRINKIKFNRLKVKYDFDLTSQVHHFLNMFKAKIENNGFEDKPVIEFLLKPSQITDFKKEIVEATNAKVKIEKSSDEIWI